MANTRSVHTILENATGAGQPNIARTDGGQLASTGNHQGVLAFKDSSGNDVKPQLNASGQLPVTSEAAGTHVFAVGSAVASGSQVDVAAITLTASTDYTCIAYKGACTKDTLFEIIQDDNGADTVLDSFIVGPGQFSFESMVGAGKRKISSGATGVQELIIRGTSINGNSDFYGSISAQEL